MNTSALEERMAKSFDVGDQVTWRSQAGGFEKKKVGTVVAIVGADENVLDVIRSLDRKRYRKTGIRHMSGERDHVSYLIECNGGVKKDAKMVLYWPRVAAIARAS